MPSEQTGYAVAEQQRDQLVELCERISKIAHELGDTAAARLINDQTDRLRNEIFRVMVLGGFNRGKTTFVNALLGEPVLPVKATPATAVITEIRSGPSRGARLWRQDATVAEEVDPAELIDRIVIDSTRPNDASPYVRAEVTWPLAMCPREVVLVDSPGLDDHKDRDAATINCLPQTDAVIFLQHAITPMSMPEINFLRTYLGPHDIFFVFTFFDAIEHGERAEVTAGARRRITEARGPDRDTDRVFFVDCKAAMRARTSGDQDGYEGSGVAEVERQLERYLATGRHKIKVMAPARVLRSITQELVKAVPRQLALLDVSTTDLHERWATVQEPLRALGNEADRISLELATKTQQLEQKVEALLTGLLETIADEAPAIAQDATPDSKLSLVPWQVKERAKQVAEEIALAAGVQIEQRVSRWVTSTLDPVVRADLDQIMASTNAQVEAFGEELAGVHLGLTGISEAAAAGQSQEEGAVARLLAGAGGFLLGGVAGGLVGGRLGAREALRTLLPTMLITVAWLFTPWGIPTLVVALFAQGMWSGQRGLGRLQDKMQTAIGTEMGTQIRVQAPKLAKEAAAAFAAKVMTPIEKAVSDEVNGKLAEVTRQVETAQAAHRDGERQVERRRAELRALGDRLTAAHNELGDLIVDVGML
jgi:hypothetical protein